MAYNVVFQRALIDAFIEYAKIDFKHIEELWTFDNNDDDDFEELDYLDSNDYSTRGSPLSLADSAISSSAIEDTLKDKVANRADQFLEALNRLTARWPEVLDIEASYPFVDNESNDVKGYFWLGTLLKPDGGIDFTQAATARAKDLLFVAAAMFLYDEEREPGPGSQFQSFWDVCFDEEPPAVCKRVRRAIERYTTDKRSSSAAFRILRSRNVDYDQELARNEAKHRFLHIWNIMDL